MCKNAASSNLLLSTSSPPAPYDGTATQQGGDFLLPSLRVGEIQPIQWRDTKKPVSKNAYRMGLDSHIRESLLEYCDCMGITRILKERLRDNDQSKDRWESERLRLQGKQWQLQRSPSTKSWRSNMHWMSPRDDEANQAFLRAFSVAGFDSVLECIGRHFGFEGLVAYHPSIIAVSRCDNGSIHVDSTNTGAKVMNVIIPLLLATNSDPELKLRDESLIDKTTGRYKIGRMQYQYNVAALVGDEVYHATSAVAYDDDDAKEEIRMAATVYVADISETNILAAMDEYVTYANHYPPPSRPELLLRSAGAHWQRRDPSKKLPSLEMTVAAHR
ncbi:hypothetical protein ACA910_008632 [Epithemia clementina (nom. ined.)]